MTTSGRGVPPAIAGPVFETSPQAILILSPDGSILDANPSAREVLGVNPQDGTAFGAIFDPSGRDAASLLQQVRQTGAQDVDGTISTTNGSAEASVRLVEQSADDGTVVLAYVEAATTRTGSFQSELLEIIPVGVVVHDADGRIQHSNQHAQTILGLAPSELEDRSYDSPAFDVLDRDGNPLDDDEYPFVRVMQSGAPVYGQAIQVRRGDEHRYLTVNGAPRTDASGEIHGAVMTFEDVTSKVHRERDLELYQSVVDYAIDPIYVVDSDGQFRFVNDAFAELSGIPGDEIRGKSAAVLVEEGIVDESALHHRREAIAELRKTGKRKATFETAAETTDGTRYLESHLFLLPDSEYRDDGAYVNIIRDVTEHKRQQEQLRERQEQFETIVDNVPIVLFSYDADGTFTQSLGRGLDMIGMEPGEAVGTNVFEMFDEAPQILDDARRTLRGESVVSTVDLGDVIFRNWYRPITDESGQLEQVIGVSIDVTEQHRREQQLEAINQTTRELMYAETPEDIAQTIVEVIEDVYDEEVGVFWQISEDAETLHPIALTENAHELVVVHHDGDALPPADSDVWEHQVFREGELVEVPDYQSLPDGYPVPLGGVIGVPLGDHGLLTVGRRESGEFEEANRRLIQTLAYAARAALDRVEREAALEQTTAELERSNESLQQFAYIASHDLQEPLRMVSSYLQLLVREYGDDLDGDAEEYVDFAVDGAERMRAMVNDLLQYSRVHTRAKPFASVDAEAVFEETLQDLELLIADSDADVAHDPLPTLEADRSQLRQVFQNLVENAISYGGDPPAVHVSVTEREEEYVFTVEDNGDGVPESQREAIFEIFKRGHGRSTPDEGTGIGLAICKRIVNRHGGDVWVVSGDGGGSAFRFSIPKPEHLPGRDSADASPDR